VNIRSLVTWIANRSPGWKRCADECSIERGHYICHQGEPDEDIYLIFSGQVALEISVPQQGPLEIERVGEGDVLGWSCLLTPRRSYFDAPRNRICARRSPAGPEAASAVRAQFSLGLPGLQSVLEHVAERLQEARLRLLDLFEPRRKHPPCSSLIGQDVVRLVRLRQLYSTMEAALHSGSEEVPC
jgi:CRP-like cAMP-binding protein